MSMTPGKVWVRIDFALEPSKCVCCGRDGDEHMATGNVACEWCEATEGEDVVRECYDAWLKNELDWNNLLQFMEGRYA